MWREDIPVLHIARRDRDTKTGRPDEKQEIKLYSNLDEVELIANRVSLGKQKVSNYNTVFETLLPFGTSSLIARGYKDGEVVEDVMMITLKDRAQVSKGDELSINVGRDCFFTSDVSNLTWSLDRPSIKGEWGIVTGKERCSSP